MTSTIDTGTLHSDDIHIGVVADINNGAIKSCIVTGTGTVDRSNTSGYTGGVAGANTGTITACCSAISVSSANSSSTGGVVGANASGTITFCYYSKGSAEQDNGGAQPVEEGGWAKACGSMNDALDKLTYSPAERYSMDSSSNLPILKKIIKPAPFHRHAEGSLPRRRPLNRP